MNLAAGASIERRPLRSIGVALAVFCRLFMGLFYFAAGLNKLRQGWMWTDRLHEVFTERLSQIEPSSFGAQFLTHFGVPNALLIANVVTLCELAAGVSMLLGFASRWGGALALWLIFMIGIGGYYDASLYPLAAMCLVVIATPSGRWFGLDRRMQAAHPAAIWFR